MKRVFPAVIAAILLVAARPAAAAQPLVDAAWARAHVGALRVVFLDIRSHGAAAYKAGHIPGAVFSDYAAAGWRVKDAQGTPGMLPPIADLEALVGGLGISRDDHVVIVAKGTNATDMGSATRVYWTFKVLGQPDVSILDGGMKAYAADPKAPLSTAPVTPKPVAYHARPDTRLLATADDVRAALKSGTTALVDDRIHSQYEGATRSPVVARYGTLPAAHSLPENTLTQNDGGTFRTGADLAALFKTAGVPTKGDTITFCNTGHWASLGWFASHELLGNKQARLYDGSMSEWAADPNHPMVRKTASDEAARK